MPRGRIRVRDEPAATFADGIAAIRTELEVPQEFPPEVLAAAEQSASSVVLPDRDCTDVPFVTIDPAGSMDLDQAMHIERTGSGYVVRYAIADVAAFVAPGGPVDVEAHRRGETLYAPDHRIPLHPPVLGEAAASLLPDVVRPALVWEFALDESGRPTSTQVRRARVRSRSRHDYVSVQQALDDGSADEVFQLLAEVGRLRQQLERERGGVSLPLPEQEVLAKGERWSLAYRAPLPVEDWNAQISLLTGMAAARLMLDGGVGLLRTLPPADERGENHLRRTAAALHIDWPWDRNYPDFVRSLDPTQPSHAAMLTACTSLLRGAGYAAFSGSPPEQPVHAAIAAPYAHATAPLRRLADRYVGAVCLELCAGQPVPDWVATALPDLPATMQASSRRAAAFERAVLDLVESGVLAPSVGETFDAVVVDTDRKDPHKGHVVISDPAVEAGVRAQAALPLGERVRVRLTKADIATRTVAFELC